ncbi:hypothetical protein TVAG_349050 [Trichomonas vaginalis G3]|uniref:Uncharacterized protein n=1 Tax=Trichomonas vaginalis (strain ATCC PRA-98 / G3) TaxID=412133 RepID=A2G4H7_TRIV3|nr:hypothetical protein TVAGG3_0571440 [Trichomonas vaginalis G3]EAX87943.1 hypothetical protein TVAG_349050 [Trichomonas vaginalis G3]KAI5521936.1 hypothetical protein TVAGG3_0571440 [Trichomonas vaginalis G3]|eukprot:XP_001300873.1 hypothetical protein [Trichomonas vaginalis G3]
MQLLPYSFADLIKEDVRDQVAYKTEIRKRHEYFLYSHVSRSYDDVPKVFCTETLWKAKQFEFRAASHRDFGYCDIFKDAMIHGFIPEHKGKLSDEELLEIEKFVNNAKPEDFLIYNPETEGMVPYSWWNEHRLNVAIRDLYVPNWGTQYIGKGPLVRHWYSKKKKYQWFIDILNGRD